MKMKKTYIIPKIEITKAELVSIICASTDPKKGYGLGDEEGSYHQDGDIKEIDDENDNIWDDLDITAKGSSDPWNGWED